MVQVINIEFHNISTFLSFFVMKHCECLILVMLLQILVGLNITILLGHWFCIKNSGWNNETLLAILLEDREPRE